MKIPKTVEGLIWAIVGGAATSALELKQYLTQWKEWEIDWSHLGALALVGGVFGGAMFLRDLANRRQLEETALTATRLLNANTQAMMSKFGSVEGAPGPPAA